MKNLRSAVLVALCLLGTGLLSSSASAEDWQTTKDLGTGSTWRFDVEKKRLPENVYAASVSRSVDKSVSVYADIGVERINPDFSEPKVGFVSGAGLAITFDRDTALTTMIGTGLSRESASGSFVTAGFMRKF